MRLSFHRFVLLGLSISLLLSGGLVAAPSAQSVDVALPRQSGADEETVDMVQTEAGGVWAGQATSKDGVNIVGATWDSLSPDSSVGEARFRTGSEDSWGSWQEMVVSSTDESTGTEGDLVMGATDIQVEVEAEVNSATLTVLKVPEQSSDEGALDRQVDGTPVAPLRNGTAESRSLKAAPVKTVVVGTRAQWGADESLRKWSPNYMKGTNGATIHHTAGTNKYSASQVPAILRGIYRYHAVTRDWGDVGYNVFVDRFGRAWEGRRGGPERSIRTAHATGMNDNSAGIALVGDYSTTNVPTAAFNGLAQVTAWKLATHKVSARGTFANLSNSVQVQGSLGTIHGHRDVNQTSCPGARFYARMGEFRTKVRSYSTQAIVMQRVAGSDRYETAAELAEAAHPFGVDTVYITHGSDSIDSLTVGTGAAHRDDALLLTESTSLPTTTAKQLRELKPKQVVVAADSSRVSSMVLSAIKRATPAPVRRIDADDQYDLAATMSRQWRSSKVVYVATTRDSADALSGGAAAAHQDAPLLLTSNRSLPSATSRELARLEPREVVVLGGTTAVPTEITDRIRRAVPSAKLTRIGGTDRYDTSALISRNRFNDSSRAFLAQGRANIDAITGTQYAASTDSPVYLVQKSCRPKAVSKAMDAAGTDLHVLLGGASRLDDSSSSAVCQ